MSESLYQTLVRAAKELLAKLPLTSSFITQPEASPSALTSTNSSSLKRKLNEYESGNDDNIAQAFKLPNEGGQRDNDSTRKRQKLSENLNVTPRPVFGLTKPTKDLFVQSGSPYQTRRYTTSPNEANNGDSKIPKKPVPWLNINHGRSPGRPKLNSLLAKLNDERLKKEQSRFEWGDMEEEMRVDALYKNEQQAKEELKMKKEAETKAREMALEAVKKAEENVVQQKEAKENVVREKETKDLAKTSLTAPETNKSDRKPTKDSSKDVFSDPFDTKSKDASTAPPPQPFNFPALNLSQNQTSSPGSSEKGSGSNYFSQLGDGFKSILDTAGAFQSNPIVNPSHARVGPFGNLSLPPVDATKQTPVNPLGSQNNQHPKDQSGINAQRPGSGNGFFQTQTQNKKFQSTIPTLPVKTNHEFNPFASTTATVPTTPLSAPNPSLKEPPFKPNPSPFFSNPGNSTAPPPLFQAPTPPTSSFKVPYRPLGNQLGNANNASHSGFNLSNQPVQNPGVARAPSSLFAALPNPPCQTNPSPILAANYNGFPPVNNSNRSMFASPSSNPDRSPLPSHKDLVHRTSPPPQKSTKNARK